MSMRNRPGDLTGVPSTGFPRRNWIVAILLRGLVEISYSITVSSMHQYITTPSAEQLAASNHTDSGIVPGFGKSEVFYTWAVTMYSVGEVVGAFSAPPLSKHVPYRLSFAIGALASLVAFLFYSLAPSIWFVLVARFFVGVNNGLLVPLVLTYLIETSTDVYQRQLELEKEQTGGDVSGTSTEPTATENPLKHKLFTAYTFSSSGTSILLLGVSSIGAKIKRLNPHTWPGWFMLPFPSLLLLMLLFVFKDHRSTTSSDVLRSPTTHSSTERRRCGKLHIFVIIAIIAYVGAYGYAFLDTLLNPILSDHFGFRIEDQSYVVVATAFFHLFSSFLFWFIKWFGVNTRQLFITGMTMAILGQLLMADWQAIGHDICKEMHEQTYSDSFNLDNSYVDMTNGSFDTIERRACELLSTDTYQCFWNPHSQVTGEYCAECLKVCRSVKKSLTFVQFSLGLIFFISTLPMVPVAVRMLASEVAPVESVATLLGLIAIVSSTARFVTPFWLNATYRAAGEHTKIPTTICAAHSISAMIVILVKYKWLAPIAQRWESTVEESDEEIELGTVKSGAAMYERLKCVETEECIDDSNLDSNLDIAVPLLDT